MMHDAPNLILPATRPLRPVQIAGLLALEVGIFLCKRIPYIGVFAHPVVRHQLPSS